MSSTFVIDLDGTLLRTNGELHPDVSSYIVQLQEAGFSVVIATGRKYIEAKKILDELKLKEHKGAAILADGQYLIDYRDETEIAAPFLVYPDDFIEIMNCFGSRDGSIKLIATERDYDVFLSIFALELWKHVVKRVMKFSNPFRDVVIYNKRPINDIEKIAIKPWNKDLSLDSDINNHYEISFINDKKRFECKHKAVNKSEMLKKYIRKYNIPENDVVVFGNDENDLCMFDDFINSFVVDAAGEHIKIRAKEIIHHNEGLGIVEKIKEIVKGEYYE